MIDEASLLIFAPMQRHILYIINPISGTRTKKDLQTYIEKETTVKKIPFQMARIQLPLIPAFAMTINKSQGQSFKNVGLYL